MADEDVENQCGGRAMFDYQPFVTPAFNEARFQISADERWVFFLAEVNYDPAVKKTNTAFELFRAPLFAPSFTTHTDISFAMNGLADETYLMQFSPDLTNWRPWPQTRPLATER